MINITDKGMCVGCGACEQKCPKNCIHLINDDEGFLYPSVDKYQCINCGMCNKVCPVLNYKKFFSKKEPKVLCASNVNEEIRCSSSSGGIFSVIAEYVIKNGGNVFGVAFTDDYKGAIHTLVYKNNELNKIRGSKYLQSSVGNTFSLVKKMLLDGKLVLFSGTPCQVNGLKQFLGKDYTNLICVDIVCHGVTSPKLWSKYINYLESKKNTHIKKVNFRDKKYGWECYGIKYFWQNDHFTYNFNFLDPYFLMYNSGLALRPSCYMCKLKDNNSGSDITLGDFWNIDKISRGINDNKGLSMVFINTEKGENIFECIKSSVDVRISEVPYLIAQRCNPSICQSMKYDKNRANFYKDLNDMDFVQLEEKYVKIKFKLKLKSILMKTKIWDLIKIIRKK